MNWTWTIRARDGAMNGLEFTQATTAGGYSAALVHAAPAQMSVTIRADNGALVAESDLDREGDYSPITLLEIEGASLRRSEIWPTDENVGMVVMIAGGEAGILQRWENAADRSWWRWSVEFSNHVGRPEDWAPED